MSKFSSKEPRSHSSGFYWLASFPKSGNTWVRAFLQNLLIEGDEEFNINRLEIGEIASSKDWLEKSLGLDLSEFSDDEIQKLRPAAYRQTLLELGDDVSDMPTPKKAFRKIHDAFGYFIKSSDNTEKNQPWLPYDCIKSSLIIVRNPLDIALSYANHAQLNVDEAIEQLCDKNNSLCNTHTHYSSQTKQVLFSWSKHIESWLTARIPKYVLRYEDMQIDALNAFTQINDFFHLNKSKEQVNTAIKRSEFGKLHKQEADQGFNENTLIRSNNAFFHRGKMGQWKTELSEQQVNKVIQANKTGMTALGYLDKQGYPLVEPLLNASELNRQLRLGKLFPKPLSSKG